AELVLVKAPSPVPVRWQAMKQCREVWEEGLSLRGTMPVLRNNHMASPMTLNLPKTLPVLNMNHSTNRLILNRRNRVLVTKTKARTSGAKAQIHGVKDLRRVNQGVMKVEDFSHLFGITFLEI
ncbi:hypothetical protein LTR40_008978, partial [Exophiala xenobiotica]